MKIKLAYCIPALYNISGMEKTVTTKANYFADILGYEVFIVTTDGKDREPAFELSEKIKVINLDVNYDNIWKYSFFKKTFTYLIKQQIFKRRLKSLLKTIKPDITISMLRREINFITKINDGSKKIGELHFNKSHYRDFDATGKSFKFFRILFARLWMKQLISNLKRLDKFVVLSYEDKAKWHELDNVTVIYNPIDIIPDETSDCNSRKVIAVGRIVRQKGFDMLLDSWKIVSARHPDWTLTIYGSGDKSTLQEQAKVNGICGNCFFEEPVLNLDEKFRESSIFAFSSRFEGFGMVISEAMASGIPPVAFACPCGPKDIIEDGKNGLLVELGDIEGLADKICYLIENSDVRKTFGKAARIRSEIFKIETIALQWDTLFKELLSYKQ